MPIRSVFKRHNRFYDTSRFGQPEIRVYHRKQSGKRSPRYLLKCGCCEDLVLRKICPVLPDERAMKAKYYRIVDESGEGYLYPASYFHLIELPQKVERTLRRTLPVAAA